MVFIECGLGGRVQCFVFDAVNLWWRRKCATAPDQTPQIKSKYHVVGAANTTHVNYTSAQHPDVAAMETSIANPPIMPGKLSNARHARRQLNCLQRLAPHSQLFPSTYFVFFGVVACLYDVRACSRWSDLTSDSECNSTPIIMQIFHWLLK